MQGNERQDFAALHCPIAPFTWALVTELGGDVETTGDIPIRFTRPVEILGIRASVIAKLPLGNLIVPTVDDLDVLLQTDNEDTWTKTLKESGGQGGFVPLRDLTIDAPRLLRIVPKGDAPDFTFQFQWAQFVDGTPLYETALIRVSLLARYLSKAEKDAYLRDGTSPAPNQ